MIRRSKTCDLAVALSLVVLGLFGQATRAVADDERRPIAAYIPLRTPLDARTAGLVQNRALEMHEQSRQEDRPAILVLEIPPGTSDLPQIMSLADFLVSPEIARVRTVAWVPKDVTGNHAILALACKEIVMHPEAELGDIGRGKSLKKLWLDGVEDLVSNRHNPKVSVGLARGMCDPAVKVIRATVTEGEAPNETTKVSVLTEDEMEEFRKGVTGAIRTRVLSEPGDPFTLTGREARDDDVLAVATAEDRTDVEKLYGTPLLVPEGDNEERTVSLVKIDGRIDPVMGQFIQRQIGRALGRGANTIIFEIDSPGGVLNDSWQLAEAIAALADRPDPVRTIAYVPNNGNEGALGGAAIVALGCDEIYMQENALIGDIARAAFEEGRPADEREATIAQLDGWMRELAVRKKRPPAVAIAMVAPTEVLRVRHLDDDRISYMTRDELVVGVGEWVEDGANPIVPESLEPHPLRVDARRAMELQIAEPPVADFESLKQRVGVPVDEKLVAAKRNWVDDVVFALNTDAALYTLVALGTIFFYLELHLVTGIFSFAGIMCFIMLFWSRFLGGTAGWLEVILFMAGLLCLVLETFVLPGFGAFGILGGVMVFASIVMATQTFGNIEPNADIRRLSRTMTTLGASIVSVIIVGLVASRYLPHIPLFRNMILHPPGDEDGPQLKKELVDGFEGVAAGDPGVASTTLRPAGKATINGRYLDVVSDGPFIQPGEAIEVVSAAGNRVVVKKVEG